MKSYYPILCSKKGELVAMQHLTQDVKESISPVVQIMRNTIEKPDKDENENLLGTYTYKPFVAQNLKTHWNFSGNQILLDFSLFEGLEFNVRFIESLMSNLADNGVNVVPVIQSNSPEIYLDLIKQFILKYNCEIAFRTSNDTGGFLDYNNHVSSLRQEIGLDPENIILILDMGQVEADSYNFMATLAGTTIRLLENGINDWKDIVVTAGSFPKDLSNFQPQDEAYRIPRYEWLMNIELTRSEEFGAIKYGDYGTRYAIYEDVSYQGTISLKYSSVNNYLIFRGIRTGDHPYGHGQFITHCENLITLDDYSGEDFSWGDLKYKETSQYDPNDEEGRRTGGPQNWVEWSQNHHISLMTTLLN